MPVVMSGRFFELARDLLVIYSGDGTIRRLNAAWTETLGLRPDDLVGRSLLDLVVEADLPLAVELLHARNVNARMRPLEVRVLSADGTTRMLEWRAAFDAAEEVFYAAARDVTDERHADRALRQSEERYRELFESHPVAMAVWDPSSGEILAANDAALTQYGYTPEELVGMHVEALVHADDLPRLRAAVPFFSTGVDGAAPFRHLRKDGSVIDVEVTGHVLEYGDRPARLVMAVDVTERRQLEEQLRQAQKMEAIGRLAGGIAHDFNNALTAITGYSQLLLDAFEAADPRREDVEQVRDAAARASNLTAQLLGFSRRGMMEPATLDLNAVVSSLRPMVEGAVGERIEVTLALRASAPWVIVDESQLEQVILNLALNARDAMPDGGSLRMETDDLDAAAAWAQGVNGGASVVLTVSDDGVGISGDVRERVFEPFFTTKPAGQGSGLGLATVYSTVRAAGGRIRLSSEPGRGTTFRILLPVAPPPAAIQPPAEAPATTDTRSARILVVEDEPAVRTLVGRVLERAGFSVVPAADGAEALRAFDADATAVDLVLTDIVMPGMSGIELVRELRLRRPGLRVLLMSGYTEDSVGHGQGRLELLAKPFTEDQLISGVRASLARAGDDADAAAR
jgi:PAS domain S-box-containing protein